MHRTTSIELTAEAAARVLDVIARNTPAGNIFRVVLLTAPRRRFLLEQWNDDVDEMGAIEQAALAYLDALDIRRRGSYGAEAVTRIDAHGAEFAGAALSILSAMDADARRTAMAEGLPLPEDFDDGELEGAYNEWLARADARR